LGRKRIAIGSNCAEGHVIDGDNVLITGNGTFSCRICSRDRGKRRRAEARAALALWRKATEIEISRSYGNDRDPRLAGRGQNLSLNGRHT
jgi:hypothetical protein